MTETKPVSKTHKRVRLPDGLARAEIVPKSKEKYAVGSTYDKMVEDDFVNHRAEYREVELYDVPVLVKVKKAP